MDQCTPIDLPYLHGMRDNSLVPFGQGWGMVHCKSKIMEQLGRYRSKKSRFNIQVGKAEQGTDGYKADKGDHETGFFNKKYTSLQHPNAAMEST